MFTYLDNSGGLNKVNTILIMLLHTCCYGEDIGVKDDVIGVKANPVHK